MATKNVLHKSASKENEMSSFKFQRVLLTLKNTWLVKEKMPWVEMDDYANFLGLGVQQLCWL